MQYLFENWRGFLNEKLVLKPGPNGWDLYAQLVADAYMAAPKFEQRAVSSVEAMVPFVEKMFGQIQSRVDVEFVDYHPYESAQQLRDEVHVGHQSGLEDDWHVRRVEQFDRVVRDHPTVTLRSNR